MMCFRSTRVESPGLRLPIGQVPRVRRRWLTALWLVTFLSLVPTVSQAQTASVTGLVTDPSGLPVPGATVTVTNTGTGVTRSSVSNSEGYYTVGLLLQGVYSIEAELQGFKATTQSDVRLYDAQALRVDVKLEIGGSTETVSVIGTRPTLQTETSARRSVLDRQRIVDLPLFGRNIQGLARTLPGVRPMTTSGVQVSPYGESAMSIAGGTPQVNNLMVDGTATEANSSGMMSTPPSPDAVEEYQITTTGAPAEFGRTGGGVVNIVSKSGTNQFMGNAWEFYRDDALRALDYFSKQRGTPKSPFEGHQFGGTFGGPLVRNRTFFFVNEESYHESNYSRFTGTAPTELQRRGDFSQTFDASGRLLVIYDPLTTRPDPNNPGRYLRDPFPGNVIPADRLNPVAVAMASHWPLPNSPGDAVTGVNNFSVLGKGGTDKDALGVRIDHYFTPSRRFFGKYTHDNARGTGAEYFPNDSHTVRDYPRRSLIFNYTDAPTQNLLIEARAGRNRVGTMNVLSWDDDLTQLGFPAYLNDLVDVRAFPQLTVSDVMGIGPNSNPPYNWQTAWSGGGSATWLAGAHTVKTGAELRVYQLETTQGNGTTGYSFNRSFTNGPDPSAAATNGHGFATFLLGYPAGGTIFPYPFTKYTTYNVGTYVQDDWKVNPRLTLNLGLRWEYESPTTEMNNQLSNFDPDAVTTVNGLTLRGAVVFPGVDGLPRGQRDREWTNFGPRAGAAYKLTPTTVVRGFWGLFHLPTTGTFVRLTRTGWTSQTDYVASVDGGLTPARSLTDPYPDGVVERPGSSLGPLTGLGTYIESDLRSRRRGTSQQWNVGVQKELSSTWTIDLGYIGNRSRHLSAWRNLNFLSEADLARGPELQQLVDNPYYGLITTGALAARQVPRAQLLLPYPQFTDVWGQDSWAASNYHAATVQLERRMSHGWSALVSYTYSRLRDNNLGGGTNGGDFAVSGSNSVQNWNNLDAEWAASTTDQPHRLVISGSYVLPFGQQGNALYRALAGGWQVNAIAEFLSGNVIAVTANAPAYGGSRPNLTGEPIAVENPTENRWLNRDAFTNVPAFTFGDAPRNLPDVRTDALQNVDFSVLKNVGLGRNRRLQLRVEVFNLFNTTTLGNPTTNINSAAFGTITTLRSGTAPRTVQLGAKFYF